MCKIFVYLKTVLCKKLALTSTGNIFLFELVSLVWSKVWGSGFWADLLKSERY